MRNRYTDDAFPEYFGLPSNPKNACQNMGTAQCEAIWTKFVDDVQKSVYQICFPCPPLIIYSEDPPQDEWNWENGFPPTDYLGCYFCGNKTSTGYQTDPINGRRIELYPARIADCAQFLFSAEPTLSRGLSTAEVTNALERVVLVHELQHAMLHLGCPPCRGGGACKPTNYDIMNHLEKRFVIWKRLSPLVKEQHAQLGTWHLIRQKPMDARVFKALIIRQPEIYQLDKTLMMTPSIRLWTWMCYMRRKEGAYLRKDIAMKKYLHTNKLNFDLSLSDTLDIL